MQGDAVDDRAHRVLPDAEVQVPAGGGSGEGRGGDAGRAEGVLPIDEGVVGASQVGGAAPQLRHLLRQGLERGTGGLAGRDGLAGLVARQLCIEALRQLAGEEAVEEPLILRVGLSPGVEALAPLGLRCLTTGDELAGVLDDLLFNREGLVREAQVLLDPGDLLGAQGRAVRSSGVHCGRRTVGDHAAHADEGGLVLLLLRALHGVQDAVDVLTSDLQDLPAVGLIAGGDVLGEGDGGVVLDGDTVIVPEDDEVAQLLGTCQGAGLGGDALLDVAVGGDDVDEVVEGGVAVARVRVEECLLAAGCHRHAHGGRQALAERTGGDLHAVGVTDLRVAGGQGAPLAQLLDVLKLQAETAQVQLDVLGERRVTTGEDEAVATDPGRVLRVVAQYALVERVRQGSQAHRGARVARTALLHGIGGKHAGKVDRPGVLLGPIRREVADHQCLELGREIRIIRHELGPSSGYDVLGL